LKIPLNITGGSYPSKAVQLSAQVTRNFYPELQDDPFTKDRYVLQPWPGLTLFGSSSGSDRGMYDHQETLYKVSGITLYSVDNAGVHTPLGTITGSEQCIFASLDTNLIVANGSGLVFQWDGVTLAEITDADLETPNSVAILNQKAIYDGDDGRFGVSAVGDATDVNGLDYATAESNSDALIRVYYHNGRAIMFGRHSVEEWFDAGVGRPPLDRVEGANLIIGLAARMSVASNETSLYWLSDERKIYRNQQTVSTIALSNEFSKYTTVDDAVAYCFTLQGQNFYHISFPTEDKTWVFSEAVGQWFELARSTSTGRDRANSYAWVYGKHLVADYANSNIYYWDLDNFTENGSPLTRERTTGAFHSGMFGQPGHDIELNMFEIIGEKGVGNLVSTDPQFMLQLSTDGGKTFGTEMWESAGPSGQFNYKVRWHGLGRSEQFVFRIKTSDAAFFSIQTASAEVELAI
jgi:hypothetical protein